MNKKIIGFFSLLLAGLTFGSFGIWIRMLNTVLTIYQQIFLRSLFAAIFAFLIIVFGKRFIRNGRNLSKTKVILFGLIVFKEIPLTREVFGGLFVLSAIILPNIHLLNVKRETAESV